MPLEQKKNKRCRFCLMWPPPRQNSGFFYYFPAACEWPLSAASRILWSVVGSVLLTRLDDRDSVWSQLWTCSFFIRFIHAHTAYVIIMRHQPRVPTRHKHLIRYRTVDKLFRLIVSIQTFWWLEVRGNGCKHIFAVCIQILIQSFTLRSFLIWEFTPQSVLAWSPSVMK